MIRETQLLVCQLRRDSDEKKEIWNSKELIRFWERKTSMALHLAGDSLSGAGPL